MKLALFFSALTLLFALTCCQKKEEEEKETSSPTEEKEQPHPSIALMRKKIELQQQLESLIAKIDSKGHKELREVEEKAREADRNFYNARLNHPKLQKLHKKAAGWQGRRSFSDPVDNAKTAAMMQEINTKIEEIAATLPELQAARTAQAEARLAIHNKKRELAQNLPEAQPILTELAEIDAQLVELRP